MPNYPQVLVAMLGGQPQVVTFTLDLLLQAGYPISEVIVVHPRVSSQPRLQQALHCLNAEFMGDYYQAAQRTMHFRSYVLELDGHPIDDIIDHYHADGTLDTIHRLIGDLKRQRYSIHLSVSGGRRLMSLLATSVATLNFDHHDHIWHIYTPNTLKDEAHEGRVMHVPAEAGVRLIQAPFVTLGAYMYPPTQSFHFAQAEQRQHIGAHEHACCAEVVQGVTPAQLKVLQAFARGLRPQQVSEELSIALVTVNTHKTALLNLCHNAWNVPDKERLDYHFLRAKFVNYFQYDA